MINFDRHKQVLDNIEKNLDTVKKNLGILYSAYYSAKERLKRWDDNMNQIRTKLLKQGISTEHMAPPLPARQGTGKLKIDSSRRRRFFSHLKIVEGELVEGPKDPEFFKTR